MNAALPKYASEFIDCRGKARIRLRRTGWKSVYVTAKPGTPEFTERVVMHKGRLAPNGSTATAYCWLVWQHSELQTRMRWIAPCRKRLERADDYT